MRPGVDVLDIATAPPRSSKTNTAVGFVVGFTEKGPLEPLKITSEGAFKKVYGEPVNYSDFAHSVESALKSRVAELWISRQVGPDPLPAGRDLTDGTNPVLRVAAESVGVWGNDLRVAVVAGSAGGTFVLVISTATGTELERSKDLADRAEAVEWGEGSEFVNVSLLAGAADPLVAAAAALTGGTDDHENATDDELKDALDRFSKDLGPGQVAAFGATTETAHQHLLDHAALNNRYALCDGPDTDSVGTLRTAAQEFATYVNARFGMLWGSWARIVGLVPRTERIVPWTAIEMGRIAQTDRTDGPNQPAAGLHGRSAIALGTTHTFDDSEIESLIEAGVNIAKSVDGAVEAYGFRSLAPKATFPKLWQASNMRLLMAIRAKGRVVMARHLFNEVDGQKIELGKIEGELDTEVCRPYYDSGPHRGSLFGETAADAYFVDAKSDDVNPVEQLQDGEVRARISVRPSPHAEHLVLELIQRLITEPVS